MNGRTSKKQATSNIFIKTAIVVEKLKRLSDGWGGETHKKPAIKAVRRVKRVLNVLEDGHMPWPSVSAVANGGLLLAWTSLQRDIMLTIDPDGDIQFTTSLKKLDISTAEIIERLDSEGSVTDLKMIDHMMAWYCLDKSYSA